MTGHRTAHQANRSYTKPVAYENVLTPSSSTSERDLPGTALLVATLAASSLTVRQTQQLPERRPDSLAPGSGSFD